jgi:2-succinyl-5-enolpyruvyl-6-hydroxy-3-cyclohexene-1-carboxylate synthase
MPVRLANLVGIEKKVLVRSNRGTSGIDGTNATTVGNAISGGSLVTLITGDIAFFYDRNAFWHHESLHNLRIIILNNRGGGIFGMIDGPARQPELEEYFLTPHSLTAENTAKDYNLQYLQADDQKSLEAALSTFWDMSDNGKVLEVFTKQEENQKIYRELKNTIQRLS